MHLRAILLALSVVLSACQFESSGNPAPSPVTIAGRTYDVVRIAGRDWTSENYSGPTGMPYRPDQHVAEYGRYYTYDELLAVPLPEGWRIPTQEDYRALALSQGVVFEDGVAKPQPAVSRLASLTRWKTASGNNSSGFNAHPAGYSLSGGNPLDGDIAEFWAQDKTTFSIMESVSGNLRIMFYSVPEDAYHFPARFVRDDA